MNVQLSECFQNLPQPEIRRLQKVLKVILRHTSSGELLRKTLDGLYRNMGRPSELLENMEQKSRDALLKLLDSYGVLTADQLTEDEVEQLRNSPFTIWMSEKICVAAGEALGLFAEDQYFRARGFLFAHMKYLPGKEMKAWGKWLGLGDGMRREKDRARNLYNHLGELSYADTRRAQDEASTLASAKEDSNDDIPEYLEDVFPNDPLTCPVAWYYRDVLPLYESMARAENAPIAADNEQAARLIQDIKQGRVVVRQEAAEFGQPARNRLVRTRENIAGPMHDFRFIDRGERKRENYLF